LKKESQEKTVKHLAPDVFSTNLMRKCLVRCALDFLKKFSYVSKNVM